MKTVCNILVLTLFISGICSAKRNTIISQTNISYQPGVIVVKLRSHYSATKKLDITSTIQSLRSKYNVQTVEQLIKSSVKKEMIGRDEIEKLFIFRVPETTNILSLAKIISQDQSVEFAEPDYVLKSHTVPNDSLYNQIYPLGIVRADSAWEIQKGDSTVIIGIIDTGVDWDHPDLTSSIWKNKNEIPGNNIDDDGNGFIDDTRGWDFVDNGIDVFPGEDGTKEDNDPMDFDGHGTHVAGIAAGCTNNGTGISSLSWGCSIMPLRVGWHMTNGNGAAYSSDMAKAFIYAADNGAAICNLSFDTSPAVLEGALYAYKNGVMIVNSAGNSAADELSLLGGQSWALSVAATNSEDKKASYSSFHSTVDVSAPGGDVSSGNLKGFLSTIVYPSNFYANNQYVEFQGTSMASPLVAALAGLIKSQHKNWTPAQIMFQIVETADDLNSKNPLYANKLGTGRINAFRALTETVSEKPKITLVNEIVDDISGGDGNGYLDPGETVNLNCILENEWGDAHNVSLELESTNSDVTILKNKSSYGTLRGISNLDSAVHGSLDEGFRIKISLTAKPQSLSFTLHINTTDGYQKDIPFELRVYSKLLFVDDDDGFNNIEQYYSNAFNHFGIVYDVWNKAVQGEIPFNYLQKFKAVVWACEWAFPSLDISDRNSITTYLKSGGSLFLSGQDIGWELADSTGGEFILSDGTSKIFYEQYLKSKYINDNAISNDLSGIGDNVISNNLTIARNQPGRGISEQFPDVIDTINGSNYCFRYTTGNFSGQNGAIIYSKDYKLVYFGFGGFESVTDSNKRNILMERIIKFLSPEIPITNFQEISDSKSPESFSLEQNYPNPFNPSTVITYSLPVESYVSLKVFDVLGREVTTLVNDMKKIGTYSVTFDSKQNSSGVYIYRMQANRFTSVKKMVMLK